LATGPDVNCARADGRLHLEAHNHHFDVWMVAGARTVDEAVSHISAQIKDEFKDFKSTSTTPLTIAGSPAERLMGSGAEADDGDPGTADVVVFKAGEHVFIACTHGEDLSADAQQWMLTTLQSAHAR
jgi:hypothetical protein